MKKTHAMSLDSWQERISACTQLSVIMLVQVIKKILKLQTS